MTETSLTERWLWLTVSLGLAILTIGVQQVRTLLKNRAEPEHQPVPPRLKPLYLHTLRLLYAVGIPALALLWRGAFTERWLGLKSFPWATGTNTRWEIWTADIGHTLTITVAVWLILTIAEHTIKRHTDTHYTRHHNLGIALREAIYHQVHWAFYREPFVLLWDVGLGAWVGLIPVGLEAGFNPERWMDLESTARGRNLIIRAGLAVVSVILYIQTQNLWLAILADTVLGWAMGQAKEN